MQVQQKMNNQPAFGKLMVSKETIRTMINRGDIDEFKKAVPELKQMSKKTNIRISDYKIGYEESDPRGYSCEAERKVSIFKEFAEYFGYSDIEIAHSHIETIGNGAVPATAESYIQMAKNACERLAEKIKDNKIADEFKLYVDKFKL